MRVAVVGAGYVGLVVAGGLSDLGLTVTCADVMEEKIRLLQGGGVPIFERGLAELVARNVRIGRLSFTADVRSALAEAQVIFLAVGTDAKEDGHPDLCQLWSAADLIAEVLDDWKVIAIKSTVPVGTAARLRQRIREKLPRPVEFDVVSNPEFLREGSAVEDFFHPNRIVIGASSERAIAVMKDIYRPLYLIQTPILFTSSEAAEVIKYAANSFLAMKVSFVNELANLCDAIGPDADIHVVAHALGLDPRIGSKFLHPSPGFGGYCFPKDTRALTQTARQLGMTFKTVEAAIEVNDGQFLRVIDKLQTGLGGIQDKVIAVLGLSFKPQTDDVRESRALKICHHLIKGGSTLRVFDPAAMVQAKKTLPSERVTYCADSYEAARGVDALVIATEWNEFRNLDLVALKRDMKGDLIVDARNVLDREKAKTLGFRYLGMGRS